MAQNNAKIIDTNLLIQAGINPKNGLPIKFGDGEDQCMLKVNIKRTLRILDEQDAINRYKWFNLPSGLDGQLLERILYYRAQGMFFYSELDDKFYFLPYALSGTIDIYGRFTRVAALPFNGNNDDANKKPVPIEAFTRDVYYDVVDDEDIEKAFIGGCVLLSDYSKQISQTNISRQILQDPILDAMAEAFPLARTSLIANSGVKGVRVNDEDQQAQVKLASRAITKAALTGDPWVPMVGTLEYQELTEGAALKSEEYLLYMQAVDNYRLSLYGLSNGGLFQKKSHMLEAEQQMNSGNVGLVYQDGLTLRQRFCDIVNSIWGLGIWCEPSETVLNADMNGDGVAEDNDANSQTNNGGEDYDTNE